MGGNCFWVSGNSITRYINKFKIIDDSPRQFHCIMANRQANKSSIGDSLAEIISFLQIVASPLLIGSGLGFLIFLVKHDHTGLILFIALAFIGLCIGIFWAIRVSKKGGTVNFMSRQSDSPELDMEEEPIDRK